MRRQDGFTIVAAVGVLMVVVVLGAAVLGLALRRQDTSVRDRWVVRAAAAADAGADVAGWRMNRTLVSAGTAGLLGLATDTVRQLGCTSVSAAGLDVIEGSGTWCPETAEEQLGDGSSFTYRTSLDVNAVGSGLADTVVRKVLVTGRAGGQRRRLLVTFRLDVDPSKPVTLFRRWHDVACTSTQAGAAPDSGCPDVGL